MSSIDDLSMWLLEQIAEDERLAREAQNDMTGFEDDWQAAFDVRTWPFRNFIGAYPPQRALAECEAKRRLIADVVPKIDALDDALEGEYGAGAPAGLHEESELLLKLLALPYADRPGYQESWRP